MKNTNRKDFTDAMKAYLIPIIEDKAQDCEQSTTGKPFSWVLAIARAEVPHEFARHGTQGGLEYWLSGLGMSVACYNSDIVEIAEKWHECKLNEKEQEMVIDRWFSFLAAKMMMFAAKE